MNPDAVGASEQEAIFEQAFSLLDNALRRDLSAKAVFNGVRKIDVLLDNAVADNQRRRGSPACKIGCDHCCHSVVFSTMAEVIHAATFVEDSFDPQAKTDLETRLERYERAVAPSLGHRLHLVRTPCPFLDDHRCLIYKARPLACRAMNAMDPAQCEYARFHPADRPAFTMLAGQQALVGGAASGIQTALENHCLEQRVFDFGRAMRIALMEPDAIESYLQGGESFAPARPGLPPKPEGSQVNQPPRYTRYGPGELPSGQIEPLDLIVHFYHHFQKGDTERALEALGDVHPAHAMRRMLVPLAYSSEEEIPLWRERFIQAVTTFSESKFDPREAFDAIRYASTFELAYQMDDQLLPMSLFGELICNRIAAKAIPPLVEPIEKRKSGKFRVGYLSYNLKNSNGTRWTLGWLENHAEDFETYAFNLGETEDNWTDKFRAKADHFYHLNGHITRDAAFIKSLELDILIYPDLSMHGRNQQFGSLRLAPVQATAWGHPVTSGMPTIDYFLSSELMEPANGDEHYSERLVRLPATSLCYPRIETPRSSTLKAEFGLDDGPIYLMCQNVVKCHPKWDHLYRRINEATGRPIVFLGGQLGGETEIIKARFERRGIRAVWLPQLGRHDFLRLLSLSEVSIDAPSWNGGNTTVEALTFGVPVVTMPTEFMRGRHSLAFLTEAGVPGLVAADEDEYVDLVADPHRRNEAMRKLDAERLYEDLRPVRALEEFVRRATRP